MNIFTTPTGILPSTRYFWIDNYYKQSGGNGEDERNQYFCKYLVALPVAMRNAFIPDNDSIHNQCQ